MSSRPASGEQFVLERGNARVVVGALAGCLREYSIDGNHYIEPWADEVETPMGSGIVMAPWPGRIPEGRWTTEDGVRQQLNITEPGRNCAIHGLLRYTAFTAVEQSDTAVTLSAPVLPQEGYPFNLDVLVRYELTDSGLTVTHSVVNHGDVRAPFGLGSHPYLRVGDVPIEDLVLTVRAKSILPIDDNWMPQTLRPLGSADPPIATGHRIGDGTCNIAVTDIEPVGERNEHTLVAPDGSSLTMWTDLVFGWVQMYTPPDFPADPTNPKLAVAVEPQTCGANAFNTQHDLLYVEPGETWSAAWGLVAS